jgi:flagellar basal-body rod protein FlgF
MDRLIYTSLSAMRGSMARQTATANNLANAQTTGFRAEVAEAQSAWLNGGPSPARAMADEQVVAADMTAGTVISTGRDLDVAIGGTALLAVQASNGDEAYTRRGDLQVSEAGLLTTGDGLPVLGSGGPIIIPPADSISIDSDGRIQIVPAGGDPAQRQPVDQLKLASPDGFETVKGTDGLFRVRNGGVLPSDPGARVTVGSLEGSNVSATSALIDMIEASKHWDHQLKLITSARDMDTATADLMRLPE